jgi:D-alanyl-D-alanine carboxypeptidase
MSATSPGDTAPSAHTVQKESKTLLQHLVSPTGPGVAVLIARGDRVLLRTAIGRASIELGVPLSPDHVFRIASVTKIFTAATIMKLAEGGKLSLDDSLSKYLPNYPYAEGVTLRQLLNHTAGVPEVRAASDPQIKVDPLNTASVVTQIGRSPLDFRPGTRWSYSNSGYVLLGAVIEKVTGTPWRKALQELILDPVGLKQTRHGDHSILMPGRVCGYSTDNPDHVITNVTYGASTEPHAAGDLVSTLDDLFHWMRAIAGGQVVSKSGFRLMITPTPDSLDVGYSYGLGMYLSRVRGATAVGHTGQTGGFTSSVTYLPDDDITVVLLANDENFDARIVGRRLVAIALGQPYTEPVPVLMDETQARMLAGHYRQNETRIREFLVRNGKLYLKGLNGNIVPLVITAEQQLHLEQDELTYWVPVYSASGKVTGMNYYEMGEGPPKLMPRINKERTPMHVVPID